MINDQENAIYDTHQPPLPKIPKGPSQLELTLKKIALFIKKPKVITISILLLTVFVAILTLTTLSKNQNFQQPAVTPSLVQNSTQSPQPSSPIAQKVEDLNNEIQSMQDFQSK